MKPTSRSYRGFAAATLGLTVRLTLPVVFSGSILLAQTVPVTQPTSIQDPFSPVSVALQSVAPSVSPEVQRHQASQLLHRARIAVATRDIASAEKLLDEVNSLQLTYQATEDQPALVQNLVQEHKRLSEQSRTQGSSEQFRQQYARFNLIQAHTMLLRNELNLAEQLTQEASKMQLPHYSPEDRNNGLEPMAMMQKISDARRAQNVNAPVASVQTSQPMSQAAQANLGQANQLLQQARTALDSGQFEQAEQFTRQAAAFGLSEGAFAPGNSPNRLLTEIAARRQGMTVSNVATAPTAQDSSQIVQAGARQPALAPPVPTLGGTVPHIDQTIRNQEAIERQIASDVMQQLSEAQRLTQVERRPEAALEILHNLKRRIEQTTRLHSDRKDAYIQHIDKAVAETQSFQERYRSLEKQDQINEAVWADLRHRQERFLNKEEQLSAMFKEYQKLIEENRFEEALIVAKKAKDFAPDDASTQLLATMAQLVYNDRHSRGIRDLKAEGVLATLHGVDEASIIPDFRGGSMIYSPNWAELTRRRQASNRSLGYQRPAVEQRIMRQLDMPVTFNINQPIPLEQALQLLCGEVEVSHFIDRAALQEADVPTGTMVAMPQANGIKMKSVLTTILDQLGLAYVVKNELLNITSLRRARGDLVTKTYYVGDISSEAPTPASANTMQDAFNRAFEHQNPNRGVNRLDAPMYGTPMQGTPMLDGIPMSHNGQQSEGSFESDSNVLAQWGGGMGGMSGGMGGMGGSRGGMGGMSGGMGGMGGSRGGMGGMGGGMMGGMGGGMGGMGGMGGGMGFGSVFEIIQTVIAPESWEMMGVGGEGVISMHPSTQSLVIRQTEEIHAQIEDLLVQLRKMHDLQIAVEVRYITLSDRFYERMGTDFDMNFRNDNAFGRITTVNNIFPSTDAEGTPQLGTSYRGNNVTVGLDAPGLFSANASIPMNQDSFASTTPVFGGYNPAVGISTGFALLSNIETYFFIQAAQGDMRSSVMEAPKVMLQNGQMGMVNDTTQMPFVTSVTPVVADFAIGYQPIITMLNQGQVLHVQATVSNDRQHVRLTLNPTFTTLLRVETFKYFGDDEVSEETSTSGSGDDTATTATTDPRAPARSTRVVRSGVTIQQPVMAEFSVSTTVSCPDGGTVLLGGIKRLMEARSEAGVPILNKLPYIQRLFSNTGIGRDTESVMIMVTPRIIIQEEEEDFIMGRNLP